MTTWMDTAYAMPTLGLGEVNQRAALQTRVDRKYILRSEEWQSVLGSLDTEPSVLDIDGRRSFRYASTYYDTPDLLSFRAAAHKRPRRYKVRTRHYLDSGTAAVEVKLRSRSGRTAKSRQWLDSDAQVGLAELPATAEAFVASFELVGETAQDLTSVLTTSYERVTLVTADARVTVDQQVAAADVRGVRMDYGDFLIVETKAAGRAGVVDRALWENGIRPTPVSKYCTSLAALRPELPSNRWARTLRRHVFTPAAYAAAS